MDTPCDPQLENGYTRVANDLFDAIIHTRFSRRQYAVLLAIVRKTYGYNRKTTPISIRQIAAMTGLDRANVIRTVRELVNMAVLVRNEMPGSRDGAQVFEMGLNKYYNQWRFPGCNPGSGTSVKVTSLAASSSVSGGCQNDTLTQIDTKIMCNSSDERQIDTQPSVERSIDVRNGCQNDTRPQLRLTGVEMTPPPFGGCQNNTRNGCQNDTPQGVKMTPPTIKDKKIKDNTKTTTPPSATQTSPHLRRGDAEGATAQPTTMPAEPSECAIDRDNPGVVECHRNKTPTTFHVETSKGHGSGFQGAVPDPASATGSCLGADSSDGRGADISSDADPNHAEGPARDNAPMDFALSPPDKDIGKRTCRQRPKPGDAQFHRFWAAYPRKKSKMQARKAFDRLAPDEDLLAHILESLERAKKSPEWRREGGQYIPYPATWLRAQGWLDEFTADAYTPAQLAVLEQYNAIMGEAGWPPAILAPYCAARASSIDGFLGFSSKPDMPERYFRYCAKELTPRDGCGFDWLIRQDVFLRIREGVIAKREPPRIHQWA